MTRCTLTYITHTGVCGPQLNLSHPVSPQKACHDRLIQRRAQQDACTPEKMKRNQSLVANSNLSLEEKKRKILRSLRRLEGLGVLKPPDTENQILQMIAKVTNHKQTFRREVMACLRVGFLTESRLTVLLFFEVNM